MELPWTTVVLALLSREYPRDVTVCPEQTEALAVSSNGEATDAPWAGLFTVMPSEADPELDAVTVTVTSLTHTPPLVFQAFT